MFGATPETGLLAPCFTSVEKEMPESAKAVGATMAAMHDVCLASPT